MNRILIHALILWFSCVVAATAQHTAFDSFVSKIARQYKVDIALSPELIPLVDSILESGTPINSIDVLLHLLVNEEHLTYQIVDGNKLMLRKDDTSSPLMRIATIEGTILDQAGNPLPYAVVRMLDGYAGCQTNENGHFKLSVTDTTSLIEVDYLGYNPVQKPITYFMRGPATIKMKMHEIPLEEVMIVIPYKEMYRDEAAQSLNLKQFELISEDQLLQWNVDRMITTLTSYSQFSLDEGIRIRGVDAGNTLFLMDGLPVYGPYHFYNIFSPFNSDYFSSIKLYKNNLPVGYGGRIDGMVQLESTSPSTKNRLILDSDLLLSSLETKVAIGKDFSFSLGGRVSHTGILNEALSDSSTANFMSPGKFKSEDEWTTLDEPRFNFYDINAGLTGKVGSNDQVYANFFKSKDQLNTTTTTSLMTTFQDQEVVSVNQVFTTQDDWKNQGVSVGYENNFSKQSSLSFDGFYSQYHKEEDYYSVYDEARFYMNRHMENSGFQNSELTTIGLKATLKNNLTPSGGYQIGLDLNHYEAGLEAKENGSPYVSQTQKELETTLFGEYRQTLSQHLMLSLGSRITHLNNPSRIYLLPNIRANYFMGSHFHLRTAFSQNVQAVHELTIENRFGREVESLVLNSSTEKYPVLKSDKYMFGGGYTSTHFSFDAEVFYKKLNGLIRITARRPDPGFNDHNLPDNFYELFTGEGWTAGIDLTAFYKKGKSDFVVSYTLSKIAEQYDELYNGEEFSPQEDRRHQVKVSGKYKAGPFDFSALITYKSEAPYLSYVELERHDGHGDHGEHGDIGQAYRTQVVKYLPEFLSLDLAADYSFHLFNQSAQVGVSLINATDHENIEELQHTGRVDNNNQNGLYITQQTALLGRTWNAHFKIMF